MPNELSRLSELTMSSREIAEKTGKRHAHVIRDIEKLLNDLEIDRTKFGSVYLDSKNEQRKQYVLPKRLVQNLIMGYSAKLREAVLEYIDELENKQRFAGLPDFTDPAIAARAWADQHERADTLQIANDELTIKNQELEPKAKVADRLVAADGLYSIQEAAKNIGIQQKKFVQWMQGNGWAFRRAPGKPLQGYANAIQRGLVDHKSTTVQKTDGEEKTVFQMKITPKGLAVATQELLTAGGVS